MKRDLPKSENSSSGEVDIRISSSLFSSYSESELSSVVFQAGSVAVVKTDDEVVLLPFAS
jgi:hypothetical protein